MGISDLLELDNANSKSEIFWRTNIPVSLFVLSFISIFFSKNQLRSKNNYFLILGVLFFTLYYNTIVTLKSMIENSEITFAFANIASSFFVIFALLIFFLNNKFSS